MLVYEQNCEQDSNSLHHINSAKLLTKNSAMALLWDIIRRATDLTPPQMKQLVWLKIKVQCGTLFQEQKINCMILFEYN